MFKSHIDEVESVRLLSELIKIDSVNPSLVPGGRGEEEIAEYLSGWLENLGLDIRIDTIEPKRCNVVGVLRGQGGGKSLLLNGHTDTVGYDYMEIEPLKPVIKDGKLYGRGSNDMKAGLVSSLIALKAIIDSGTTLKGDVIVAGVCDEEYASIGTERLMEDTVVDGAIIGESSDLNILRSHKGFAWIDIGTRGLAAHGSSWETGVDAITKMGKVLKGLQDIGERLSVKRHPLVGPASVHASTIKGGLELSTYPDSCLLQVERRTIPGEKKEDVRKEIEDLLNTIAKDDKEFKAFYDITFYRDPMDVPENCELLQTLFNASMDAIDYKPLFIGGSGWLDTQIIWEKGIPVVSYGPTGEGDHSAVEWVSIDSMIKAAKVQELTIRRYCGENL